MNQRPYPQTSKNAAMLFFLLHPGINGRRLFQAWPQHPVLRDYRRPDEPTLAMWVEEFIAWRNGYLYRATYRQIGRGIPVQTAPDRQQLRDSKGRFLAPWPARDAKGRFSKR